MEHQIFEIVMKQGIWAVLFIYLFYYQLKEGRRREQESIERERKVLDFITDISKQFEGLVKQYERLTEDVQDIKVQLGNYNSSPLNRK